MTRVNCVPVSELSRKNLIAEYVQLPRIFLHTGNKIKRGIDPALYIITSEYTTTVGNVSFFYNKLVWVMDRMLQIVEELHRRKIVKKMPDIMSFYHGCPIPEHLLNDWTPTEKDMAINRIVLKKIDSQPPRPKRPVMKWTD